MPHLWRARLAAVGTGQSGASCHRCCHRPAASQPVPGWRRPLGQPSLACVYGGCLQGTGVGGRRPLVSARFAQGGCAASGQLPRGMQAAETLAEGEPQGLRGRALSRKRGAGGASCGLAQLKRVPWQQPSLQPWPHLLDLRQFSSGSRTREGKRQERQWERIGRRSLSAARLQGTPRRLEGDPRHRLAQIAPGIQERAKIS